MGIAVDKVDGITRAIGVCIEASPTKRAECIGAEKAHLHGVVATFAITQQITVRRLRNSLAGKGQQRPAPNRVVTIGCVCPQQGIIACVYWGLLVGLHGFNFLLVVIGHSH
jgi:hypothetical protein